MSTNRISKNTPQEAKEINEWDDIEGSEESEIIHGYNNKLIGNSGSDELIGLSRFTSVGYRNSPEGIVVNLVDNVISDGWGFEDKVIDIDTIWDSKFDDNITGNEKNQTFWIDLGNDTVNGGNGHDIINYWFNSKEDFISLNKVGDLWELEFSNQGNNFTTKIQNVENILIKSDEGVLYDFVLYDNTYVEKPDVLKSYQLDTNTTFYDYFFSKNKKGYISIKNLITSEIIDLDRNYGSVTYDNTTYNISQTGVSEGAAPSPYFHRIFNDGNKDILVLTYMTGLFNNNTYINSTGSRVSVYSIDDGKVVDLTSQYFNNDATTYWARDLHITDLNNDERLDLFISSQGREVGGADGYKNAPDPRINPVWGEQNQLFIGSTNGWIESPDFSYPETVDFSHGSVVGNFTNKVNKQIIVNNLGTFDGYPNKYLIEFSDGNRTITYYPEIEKNANDGRSSWLLAGDFNQDGYDDLVGGEYVFWGGNSFGSSKTTLPLTDYESIGFVRFHGGVVADFNHDGIPEIIKISASNGNAETEVGNWEGLRFSYFGYVDEKFEDWNNKISEYEMGNFGIETKAIDIDFDGHLDLITTGGNYDYGSVSVDDVYILRNDGSGNFKQLKLNLDWGDKGYKYFLDLGNNQIGVLIYQDGIKTRPQILSPETTNIDLGNYGAGKRDSNGFDEQFYLNKYPEVQNSLDNGDYENAYEHFKNVGANENYHPFAKNTVVWLNKENNDLKLREGNEKAYGFEGKDTIEGGAGNDVIDGGAGVDTAIFKDVSSAYTLTNNDDGTISVVHSSPSEGFTDEGSDTLTSIEKMQFSDKTLSKTSLKYELSESIDTNQNTLTAHSENAISGTLNFNAGDNIVILDGQGKNYRGLSGDDTYFVSQLIPKNTKLSITDTDGTNIIQVPANTYVDKSLFTKNAARLTLEDGREITINSADKFSYNVGGNVTNGTKGTDLTFAEFAEVFGVYDILNSSGAQTGTISDLYII